MIFNGYNRPDSWLLENQAVGCPRWDQAILHLKDFPFPREQAVALAGR